MENILYPPYLDRLHERKLVHQPGMNPYLISNTTYGIKYINRINLCIYFI